MSPLNCIVDDSALVASVKSSAVHSIVPWINQGSINVFVPLYALDRLARLARIHCPVSNDAAKALRWLDQVTTWTEHKIAGRVKLQEPDDQYPTWDEVEQYLLPDADSKNTPQRLDRLSKMLDQGLNLNGHQYKNQPAKQSPDTSPRSATSSLSSTGPAQTADTQLSVDDETSSTLSAHGIHPQVRPLLNFTVWCTNNGGTAVPGTAAGKYILVTNDYIIQKQASKFGVRAKLLNQLQNALGKEARVPPTADAEPDVDVLGSLDGTNGALYDDEDEVVFDPSQRPNSSRGPKTPPNVIDPNHFGRSPKLHARGASGGPGERANGRSSRGANRTRGSGARGSGGRGRGGPSPPGKRTVPPGPTGQRGNGRARGGSNANRGGNNSTPRQIDPDSFARPAHMSRRGRGGHQKLWDPANSG